MYTTLTQLAHLLRPFKRSFLTYLCMVILYEAAQVLNSYMLTGSIRLYEQNGGVSVWVAFMAAVWLFDTLFRNQDHWMDWHIVSKLLYPVYKHIKMLVLKVFLTQDSAWHQRNNSAVLIGKADNGSNRLQEMVDMLAWEFFPTLTQCMLTLPPLFYFSPITALVILCALSLFIYVTHQAEKFRLPLRKKRHDMYEDLWHGTEEAVKAHETLAVYGQTQRIIREHEYLCDQIVEIGTSEVEQTIFKFHNRRTKIIQITGRLILLSFMVQLYRRTITVAEVFFVYTLSERLLSGFWRFARMMQRVGECSEGISRLYDLSLQTPSIVDDKGTFVEMDIPERLDVEFRNVSFAYPGNSKEAIRNLNLVINDGEEIAVVGPSGSGKTTLRRLLLRLYEVTEGEILIGGIPIKQWPLEKLRSLFAFVPQGDEVFIFDSDIEYNIRFSRPEASFEEVQQAARQAGLQSFIESLPEGYKTRVGEKGMKLSGGQKQRIALARAIVSGRRFLILDEATSSVDALTEQEIERGLREVRNKVTSVVIAHRLHTVWNADKIVVLQNGRKVSEGTHEDLMCEEGGVYERMVKVQTVHT